MTPTASVLELPKESASDKIFSVLFKQDEITWQSMIHELVATEEMNPWDIDVSLLAKKFLETLTRLKRMDFRLSGKLILAAAILLKIKSSRLIKEDIAALDAIFNSSDEELEMLEGIEDLSPLLDGKPQLFPRTPQPRQRKVSVYDLVEALEIALEVEARRPPRFVHQPTIQRPVRAFELHSVIAQLLEQITAHFAANNNKILFTDLCPSETKEDRVYTFIPLLHLDNSRKVDLEQQHYMGEIQIGLAHPDPAAFSPTDTQDLTPKSVQAHDSTIKTS